MFVVSYSGCHIDLCEFQVLLIQTWYSPENQRTSTNKAFLSNYNIYFDNQTLNFNDSWAIEKLAFGTHVELVIFFLLLIFCMNCWFLKTCIHTGIHWHINEIINRGKIRSRKRVLFAIPVCAFSFQHKLLSS